MLRSMYSGISGMKNFQTKLDVIGNNIANVNTYGFKKGRVTFKDTMNQMVSGASAAQDNRGGKNPIQVGLGSTLATIDTIHTQSSLQTTGRSLDLAISGDGYFIVNQGDAKFYTRAGNFYLDDNGTLVNGDGYKVQAFTVNANGNATNQLGDVAVNVNAVLPAVKTSKIEFSGNLSLDSVIGGTPFTQQIQIVDANGNTRRADVHFVKASATEWNVFVDKPTTDPSPLVVTFDPTTGDSTTNQINVNGIDIDFSKLTQNTGSTNALVNPDGNTEGSLESFNIGSLGEVNGVYSNGLVRTLGILALAKFSNSSGLTKAGGNLFQESINSGVANINVAGEGRGSIAAGTLEMSNVDLSEEFTEMISAQRGFQANTRIITTSDEILQELVNLKR
ncbi:flagellar hook-basal body complex protein [Robertmurraya korlensis]|uniref:flagellar hook protein FlgE n=1 Tax=Robertmurraya korlensis TaxID=519977 RepID=UPI00203A7016|nr:flagellar hook-basal body complex protein [Robertmurraya korlensis]MCM3600183.1 flagellar hook-basal body complex protein [Robertmurraya korlensis]